MDAPPRKIGVHVPLPSRIAVTSGAEGSIACRVRYVRPDRIAVGPSKIYHERGAARNRKLHTRPSYWSH